MSNVLTSFLIGIGFDTSKIGAGVRDVDQGMDRVKGSALKVSAGLVGAFGAAAASVANTAREVDSLALKSANMRTSQQYIYNYGNALKLLGGNAEDAVSQVSNIETILNNIRLKGDIGPLADLSLAGVDIGELQYAKNAEEFMALLSKQVPKLDSGQRGVVQQSLGLPDASLKMLTRGPDQYQADLKRAEGLTGNIEDLTDNSRKLMENSAKFGLIIDGITNELADKFLPSLIGVSNWANDFLTKNRGSIDEAIKYAADNAGATTTLGVSSLASLIGAGLSKIGLSSVGGLATKAGTAGVAVSAGAIGADALNEVLGKYVPHYTEASQGFDEGIKKITGWDRVPTPMEVFFGSSPDKQAPGTVGTGPARSVARDPVGESEVYYGKVDRTVEPPYPNDEPPSEPIEAPYTDVMPSPERDMPYHPDSEIYRGEIIRQELTPNEGLTPYDIQRTDTQPNAEAQIVERQANADALANALTRAPVRIENNLRIQLDGKALEAKIIDVNERAAYDALSDIATTTAR